MPARSMDQEYFDWIYQIVCRSKRSSWKRLLSHLHKFEFIWFLDMDANRAEDGVDLRFRFANERGRDHNELAVPLGKKPCSVLEMMVALALRCEEHLMDNPDIGDRTADWFWDMIQSLGLSDMDDSRFDANLTENVLQKFIRREYEADGHGSLFVVEDSRRDMRTAEIWYQMMWYLESLV